MSGSAPVIGAVTLDASTLEAVARRAAQIVEESTQHREDPFLRIEEAARLLRCSRGRVDNLLTAGHLTRVKDGGRTLIERAELNAYLLGQPTGPEKWTPKWR